MLVTSPSDMPRLLACWRSMSTTSCGSLAVNCVNSAVSPGVWLPCAISCCAAASRSSNRPAALIEQLVGEAAELAETLNRRRQERNHHRAGDLAERAEQLADQRLRRMRLAGPLVEVLQLLEQDALVRRRAGEAEAAGREHPVVLRQLRHDLLDLLHDVHRVVERRARRRLDQDHDVALILVGHEPRRHARVDPVGRARAAARTPARRSPAPAPARAASPTSADGAAVDHAVDDAEERAFRLFALRSAARRPAPASASAR